MKIGFGLYRHMLDDAHFAFARQCGATHVVVHMCDYFRNNDRFSKTDQPVGDTSGWGFADGRVWSVEELVDIRERMAQHGLTFFAVENFDPLHWCDILFDGPRKEEQYRTVAAVIGNLGKAGIKVLGYNFSLAGVAGRIIENKARGGAQTVGLDGRNEQTESPLPNSMAWNMVVDETATGIRRPVTSEQLWQRLTEFLTRIVPVAEAAGVTLAAHPDDPPLDLVRGQPRLVNQPALYQRLLDIVPRPANALEFCLGTIAEMSEGDVYEAVDTYSQQERIAYLHFRNVRGRVPHYHETFIDEGDIDMARVIAILRRNGFEGVLIPDHSPQMSCPAPWHAGMAFAMGYMQALIGRG
ncbi:mannonate dehydratase [Kaistia hirudinis]|uniref:mannonate dehydratase n=1 Tax=Kaistia hirudinis TaxID=1293440 RepID=A0A840APJ4_9HYPH|nr:mannonate dehydratase [Kaistia hirudinis]MBB3930326.1 mannonate dehydratase [Kaistia hirudinis]MBN9017886.1 mannonate dehydratase [Hyphomicrobiales bacterium]